MNTFIEMMAEMFNSSVQAFSLKLPYSITIVAIVKDPVQKFIALGEFALVQKALADPSGVGR